MEACVRVAPHENTSVFSIDHLNSKKELKVVGNLNQCPSPKVNTFYSNYLTHEQGKSTNIT